MEIVSVICVFVTGLLAGVVGLDFKNRNVIRLELKDTLGKIQEVHNKLVKQVADVQDQVNTHEMRLASKK